MSLFTGRRRPASLDALFAPRSIAVVGASSDPRKIGGRPIAFLKRDGFAGAILPINPQHAEVQGLRAYPSLAELPEAPDLVLIALPASRTTEAVAAAAARGVKVAVLFSSGFAEAGEEGQARQAQLAATIGDSPMRLLGPNCIGAASIANGAYATFAVALETGAPPAGGVGMVSQSGALASHLHVLARMTHLGVSRWIATGNEVDIDVADGIAWLAGDAATRVIICTLESGRDGARLRAALEMARAAGKPVFVLRMGGSAIGRAAAASHTGALAGDDAIFDAVLRQGGAVRVNSIEALLDAAYVAETALARKVSRERMARARLGVVTLSGGVGVLLADVAERL
ncbi:MAG: CoA-binding protein, partial [Burkholderiales bacterium]